MGFGSSGDPVREKEGRMEERTEDEFDRLHVLPQRSTYKRIHGTDFISRWEHLFELCPIAESDAYCRLNERNS